LLKSRSSQFDPERTSRLSKFGLQQNTLASGNELENVILRTFEGMPRVLLWLSPTGDRAMDNSKIDLKKKAKPVKASPDDVKAELSGEQLSDEQLSDASGGGLFSHCATGTHFKKAIIE
jgi:hypothetical protein